MEEGIARNTLSERCDLSASQRRRSPRLTSPPAVKPVAAVKRSFAVRKIVPRKTTAPSEHDKENTERCSGVTLPEKQNVSTPGSAPCRRRSSAAKRQAVMPSPILPSPPPPQPHLQQQPVDPDDLVWSHKARRSYSRLSDKSSHSPGSRRTMFGFEKLQTPEVGQRTTRVRDGVDISGSMSGLSSFSSLLEAEDCGYSEPDLNIPGVALVKEKKRRKKVQQMKTTELDALAARMNAEFKAAEEFELVVE
ncbi:sororin [Synchiropus picturatus]